jgi:putative salt-induced outer membrane protein
VRPSTFLLRGSAVIAASLTLISSASAQQPPPEKVWSITASLGLAVTSGNKDTSTFNAGYDVTFNPPSRHLIKSDALFLRGKTDGELSSDKLAATARDEFRFRDGLFVFGQARYLSDRFKDIDYLIAPTAGLGYKILDTEATSLSLDAGVGGVWEKNPGTKTRASGAVTVDERLSRQLTATTALTQSISALWKTEDLGDALYTIGAGLALSVSARTQVKLEWLDTYKHKPPVPGIQQNDMSFIVALLFKQ